MERRGALRMRTLRVYSRGERRAETAEREVREPGDTKNSKYPTKTKRSARVCFLRRPRRAAARGAARRARHAAHATPELELL